jgi:hypothetical protein
MQEIGHCETVQVWLNGTGLYNFIFDTGTNSTLVKRELLEHLGVPVAGKAAFNGITSSGHRGKAILSEVSLGGVRVERLEAGTLEPGDFAEFAQTVMGILGENFLKCFDPVACLQDSAQLESGLGTDSPDLIMNERTDPRSHEC